MAWLLDPDNFEVLHGYALVLRAWQYEKEADRWEQIAKDKGYQESEHF